jgi:hypothetical protein
MNCILHIKTQQAVDDYSQNLMNYLGNNYTTQTIYGLSSLSGNATFLPLYFYGNTNQAVNFLIAKDSANTLRLFIEGVNRRDNIDQLVTGVKQIFQNIKSFLDDNNIKHNQISATIWSEDEEMLRGEYQGFWKKFKSFAPELPTGIYLSVLTITYSIIQPKVEATGNEPPTPIETTLKFAGVNLLVASIAILLWLLVKAVTKETNLSFKLK